MVRKYFLPFCRSPFRFAAYFFSCSEVFSFDVGVIFRCVIKPGHPFSPGALQTCFHELAGVTAVGLAYLRSTPAKRDALQQKVRVCREGSFPASRQTARRVSAAST